MKIKNTNAQKAFIVNAKSVINGGEKTTDGLSVYINPGDTVEIDDVVGQKLADSYDNIMVIEAAKDKKAKK